MTGYTYAKTKSYNRNYPDYYENPKLLSLANIAEIVDNVVAYAAECVQSVRKSVARTNAKRSYDMWFSLADFQIYKKKFSQSGPLQRNFSRRRVVAFLGILSSSVCCCSLALSTLFTFMINHRRHRPLNWSRLRMPTTQSCKTSIQTFRTCKSSFRIFRICKAPIRIFRICKTSFRAFVIHQSIILVFFLFIC